LGGSCIPTSTTRAPSRFEAWTIAARFAFICSTGSPRRPSFAPSWTITMAGLLAARALPIRAAPPAEVSPLMLAFATV